MINKTTLILICHIVNVSLLDDDVPRSASYCVVISQLIRFARVCRHYELISKFNVGLKTLFGVRILW